MNCRFYLTNKVIWQKGNKAQLKRPKKKPDKMHTHTLRWMRMKILAGCLFCVCIFCLLFAQPLCIASLVILWLSLALIIFNGIRWFVFFAHIILMTFGRFIWRQQTFSMVKPQPNGPSIWISECILHNAIQHFHYAELFVRLQWLHVRHTKWWPRKKNIKTHTPYEEKMKLWNVLQPFTFSCATRVS